MPSSKENAIDFDRLRSEGDLNLSAERAAWNQRKVSSDTASWLERDSKVFLHQSLSTPCLDVIDSVEDSQIQNLHGECYLDFHGNSVHQIGYGHPRLVEAILQQLKDLPFCPRRFTNRVAVELAEKLVELNASELKRVLFAPGGTSAIGIALKIARKSYRSFQNDFDVGFFPRSVARCHFPRWRSNFST